MSRRDALLAAREICGPDLALERQEWERERDRSQRVVVPEGYTPHPDDPF